MCGLLGMMMIAGGGCAENQEAAVLKPVGPIAVHKRPPSEAGFLVVYTAIEEPRINPDTMYAPHTSYVIYDSRGAFFQNVRNHVGAWDETPDRVILPPGKYTIKAESEMDGEVVVPIIIKPAKTTLVNLEPRREPDLASS